MDIFLNSLGMFSIARLKRSGDSTVPCGVPWAGRVMVSNFTSSTDAADVQLNSWAQPEIGKNRQHHSTSTQYLTSHQSTFLQSWVPCLCKAIRQVHRLLPTCSTVKATLTGRYSGLTQQQFSPTITAFSNKANSTRLNQDTVAQMSQTPHKKTWRFHALHPLKIGRGV